MAEADKNDREAARWYQTGIENVPDSALLHNQFGWLCGKYPKRRERGLTLARRAHALAPDSASVRDTLGWLYFLNGEHKEALKHLRIARARLPRNADVLYHLGKVQAALGNEDDARRSFEGVLLMAPRSERAEEVHSLLRRRGSRP
jgi:tetratricopeptide (TPR) repeat protein